MCKWIFHQAPQVEKESGAEGEEDNGDSQEPLGTIPKLNNNSQLILLSNLAKPLNNQALKGAHT